MICFKKNMKTQKFEQATKEELTLSIKGDWLIWVHDDENVKQIYRIHEDRNEMELVGLQIDD